MKAIIRFLYRRVVLISVAIALQLAAIIGVILKFNNYFVHFYWISIFISILAVLWIINDRSNPSYKIAWIIPILLFPIFGGLFYIFFGGKRVSKREKRKMKLMDEKVFKVLKPQKAILNEIIEQSEDASIQSRYIHNNAHYPPYNNTTGEYLPIGEKKFERLKEELKKAKHFIFMEYFIIQEGVMWNNILDILVEKVKEGVDVRIIYDDAGCLLTLPYNYSKKLEKLGIKCCVFNPMIPILYIRLNNRDHRKITIIDGHTGFTGGINLADEYINEIEKHGHWKDTAIMLKGDAVWSMTVMFLSLWECLRNVDEDFNRYKVKSRLDREVSIKGYYQPFSDSPLDDEHVGEIVYLNLINKAKRYVFITTPYLVIDHDMIKALTSAAKGGVDVRIITPHCADKWYVHTVTKSNYKILVESGVKIYEYTPGFIHAKTLVTDDEFGVVGTINMDFRSFFMHYECGVWMYKSSALKDIRDDFLNTLEVCREVKMEDFKDFRWYNALLGSVLRLLAPLM
ncbi:cardiolipin synthase [Acetivibrio cellulolyticus]|uniref:cardiolipin synthase n=1 Tax=Acetivibrio cellulolyticus TaxID=35830 RepID=UPI0001E2F66E|nr:cardiolipin synthase [Acetivibrio cellulolyticus]